MSSKLISGVSVVLGLLMLIFGLNKFIGFIAVDPPADPTAQAFMGAMFMSYLYIVVAISEIIGGLLLFYPRFRFIGWLILLPIVVNIAAFHIAHDFIGNGIWLLPTVLFMLIGVFMRERILSLLR